MGAFMFVVAQTTVAGRSLSLWTFQARLFLVQKHLFQGSPLNSSERFDPVNHAWEVMNPMLRQRSGGRLSSGLQDCCRAGLAEVALKASQPPGSVSATLGKALLVAGGGDGQQPLSTLSQVGSTAVCPGAALINPPGSAERFSPSSASWEAPC